MSRTRDLAGLLVLSMAAAAAALGGPLPPAPKPGEAREALRRVFGDAIASEPVRAVAGDFNGDGSEDLAAVARAQPRMLARVNHELANWTLQDALATPLDPGGPRRVTVGRSDVLLAVIHGHGASGWRNPEARQSYLVRNAPARPRAVEDERGHVIVDARLGRPGFLYWSGARYVWFPLARAAPGR